MNDYSQMSSSDLDELKLVLQRSPVLRALMEVAPDVMQAALRQETFPADTVLFREGDVGDRAYAIWSGRLRVQHEIGGDAPLILRELLPGDVVGEVSLLDNQPRSASVIVLEDSRLVSLSREDLQGLLMQKPEVSLALLAVLSYRLRSSDEYLVSASRSADYLARRMSDMASGKPEASGAPVASDQRTGLHTLVQDLTDAADAVTGGLTMLKRGMPPDSGEEFLDLLDLVDSHARRMTLNLDRLKDWQRLEAGEAALDLKPTMAAALAEEVAARLGPSARALEVMIDVRVQPDLPTAMADEELLKRLFSHLFVYVLRYAPPESVVKVEFTHLFRRELQISVVSEGLVVPPEYWEAVFEPFVRGPGDEETGLGIELAVCRAIVQAHAGRIWIEDAPDGQSSVFMITLPTGFPT